MNTPPTQQRFWEAELIDGLKPFALQELQTVLDKELTLHFSANPEQIPFSFAGTLPTLNQLKTVLSIYLCQTHPVPRPKGLLGHQHFQAILRQIEFVRQQQPPDSFRTFRISAAGEQSAVFQRLKTEIARHTGLILNETEADLFLRIRPTQPPQLGWQVLCRLTPRPLASRSWRVADMAGALHSTIAAAMIALTHPQPTDRFLNLMCGSGSLLVERLQAGRAELAVGSDWDRSSLAKAKQNLAAANVPAFLLQQNDLHLSFPNHSFNVLVADLPWGQLVSSTEQLPALYTQLFAEAARVTKPGGQWVFVAHSGRLIEEVCRHFAHLWQRQQTIPLQYKNIHPKIYQLQRTNF